MTKRKNTFRKFILTVVFLTIATLATYYITNYLTQPKFVRYAAFGIDIPANFSLHGIDVSRYQNTVNWKEVKNMQVQDIKISFAFIKATEGSGKVDNNFHRNWLHAKKASVPRGAYHFFICSKSGKMQAQNFIQTVTLEKGDMPPVLDIEVTNGTCAADIRQRAKDWLTAVEKQYRIKPIIYTNISFYNNYLGREFDNYPLWIAHYLAKDKPKIERNWIFWQHNENGRVNGINACVDFNVFNGDSTDFANLLVR